MSRFYSITVSPETAVPTGGTAPSNNAGAKWTNLVNGRADLGAQTVELDVWFYGMDAPVSQGVVTIWGPSKEQISQASDFNGAHIEVSAGMQKGLPLATNQASQAGIILSGQIFQAFGNWQGINQTLNFVVITDGGATQSQPANLQFSWKKGDQLGTVITQALQVAYPGLKLDVKVNPALVLSQDEHGTYQTIQQFATYIKGVSQNIIGGNYPGITITLHNGTIYAFDGSTPATTMTDITVQDLIGQPTWLSAFTVSFSTVMRGDLRVGSTIKFPPIASAIAVTGPQSQSNVRAKNAFDGTWTISAIRHVGNSRAPDAQSWISVFQAYSNGASPNAISVANSSA